MCVAWFFSILRILEFHNTHSKFQQILARIEVIFWFPRYIRTLYKRLKFYKHLTRTHPLTKYTRPPLKHIAFKTHNMTSLTSHKQIEVTLKYAFRNKPALLAEGLNKFDLNLIQLMSLDPNLTSLCSIITNGTYTPLVQPTLDSSGTTQDKIENKVRYEIEYKEYLVETKNVLKFQLLFISYLFQSCDKSLTQFIQEDPRYKVAILTRPLYLGSS